MMISFARLAVASLIFAGSQEPALPTRDAAHTAALEQLEARLAEALASSGCPGLAVALVGAEGELWSKGFGFADLEAKRAATANTPFLLASVSKTFIAALVADEIDRGELTLTTPLFECLPFAVENPHLDDGIIVLSDLLTHTSGIIDHPRTYHEQVYVEGDPELGLGEWLESYMSAEGSRYSTDNFAPHPAGEHYEYSNVGAALAAYVVELSAAAPFSAVARERLFDPLGMQSTGYFLAEFEADTLAVPYAFVEERGELERRDHYGVVTYPDGLLRSSASDLARFLAMLIQEGVHGGERLLSRDAVSMMTAEHFEIGTAGGQTSQALLWMRLFGGSLIGHDGYDFGANTFVFFSPAQRMGGVVLINADGPASQELRDASLQALTDAMRAFR